MKNIINIPNTMFISLLIFVSLTDVFGYYLADLTISNPLEQPEYIYKKCLSMNKVVYEDRCWDLLTKGPCDEGQWLVLDKVSDEMQLQEPRPLRAKCKKRRCSESDVYWPRDGFCHNKQMAHRDRLCASANTVLTIDEYGNGFCKCRDGDKVPYVRVFSSTNDDYDSQPCYPVYSKGPCPRNHVLTPYGARMFRYGVCAEDDCAEERRLARDSPSSSSPMSRRSGAQEQRPQPTYSLARWTDGQCYELGTRGPCTGREQFAVLRATARPGCARLSVELTVLPETTDGCETDHWGDCVEGVEVWTSSDELRDALLQSANRSDFCR
ncbi:uncharacterized protein LOC112593186 isoform X2 [Melanaphis sacchari]|uniref:uncharacterized protein LOC112593186 isoform X2 n=1 Tax=Melanaphis sacchari TaxID=742174 RepID=UPI000DC14C95|nr:uncharacterized protein LOC112593186 isoform X2 [Melanaphis sacchari]